MNYHRTTMPFDLDPSESDELVQKCQGLAPMGLTNTNSVNCAFNSLFQVLANVNILYWTCQRLPNEFKFLKIYLNIYKTKQYEFYSSGNPLDIFKACTLDLTFLRNKFRSLFGKNFSPNDTEQVDAHEILGLLFSRIDAVHPKTKVQHPLFTRVGVQIAYEHTCKQNKHGVCDSLKTDEQKFELTLKDSSHEDAYTVVNPLDPFVIRNHYDWHLSLELPVYWQTEEATKLASVGIAIPSSSRADSPVYNPASPPAAAGQNQLNTWSSIDSNHRSKYFQPQNNNNHQSQTSYDCKNAGYDSVYGYTAMQDQNPWRTKHKHGNHHGGYLPQDSDDTDLRYKHVEWEKEAGYMNPASDVSHSGHNTNFLSSYHARTTQTYDRNNNNNIDSNSSNSKPSTAPLLASNNFSYFHEMLSKQFEYDLDKSIQEPTRYINQKDERLHMYTAIREVHHFYEAPQFLCLHIKRLIYLERNKQLVRTKLDGQLPIPTQFYLSGLPNQPGYCQYRLQAFISHLGASFGSGHYVCHLRTAWNQWYLCNDLRISLESAQDIEKAIQQSYILFFSLCTSE